MPSAATSLSVRSFIRGTTARQVPKTANVTALRTTNQNRIGALARERTSPFCSEKTVPDGSDCTGVKAPRGGNIKPILILIIGFTSGQRAPMGDSVMGLIDGR